MKYISFTVPCYNSQDYMERCIDSLLTIDDMAEIILVDDGSTDLTGEIADNYARNYPEIVRVIHQKNGGHGAAVNAGLAAARGLYFKVVDSDDWLDEFALRKLLMQLKHWEHREKPDLIVTNYIYDHFDLGKQKRMHYRNVFASRQITTWERLRPFRPSQYLVMHALWYRTQVLRECGIRLPHHTFYVDNLFANQPLPYVKSICYLDLDMYHYYLGREDQSVHESVLMKRIDEQIRVTKLVASCRDLEKLAKTQPRLAHYLTRNISIMMAISDIHLLLIGTSEAKAQRKCLWQYIRNHSETLYHHLRFRTLSGLTYLPGPLGDALTLWGYRTARKIYKFN